ncbi:MAG: hypothetical protein RLY20_1003 [Verrucomicrobiota bacterium]
MALAAAVSAASAQETNAFALAPISGSSEVDQLRAANIRLQAQLHEAELAIERNRAEAQESARQQAAAITEKLTAIQAALDAERKRQQDDLGKQRDDLNKQRDALQKSNRTILWVSCAFGVFGLAAMVYTALFQWRTSNKLAEVSARALLPAPVDSSVVVDGQVGMQSKVVELSNQRLMAVIERLERRVIELEHTSGDPMAGGVIEVDRALPAPEPDTPDARVASLLSKGQSLLNADKAEEALICYDEILAVEANHPEALVKKGAALERLKKDEEALTCYDRAIAADGTLTIAYLYKGGVYNRLERYNEALECYEQALRVQGGAS